MAVKINTTKNYLLTEVNVELPTDIAALEEIILSSKATGSRIVAVYNQGGTIGINVEQKTKIPEGKAAQIFEILGIARKEMS